MFGISIQTLALIAAAGSMIGIVIVLTLLGSSVLRAGSGAKGRLRAQKKSQIGSPTRPRVSREKRVPPLGRARCSGMYRVKAIKPIKIGEGKKTPFRVLRRGAAQSFLNQGHEESQPARGGRQRLIIVAPVIEPKQGPAFLAYLDEGGPERRRSPRYETKFGAIIVSNRGEAGCRVLEVSDTGAVLQLENDALLCPSRLMLVPDIGVRRNCLVIRRDRNTMAVRFVDEETPHLSGRDWAALGRLDDRALEEIVCDVLRPLLRRWFDENLSRIIEATRGSRRDRSTRSKKAPPGLRRAGL